MAGITTLALLALSAAKTGVEYSNQRGAAAAAQRQGDYQGAILDQNAILAQQQADDALARGREQEDVAYRGQRQLTGAQRAAAAASGVDAGSGSAADVIANDQWLGALDLLTIRNNAKREAWGYQVQGADDRRQGVLARMAGQETARGLRGEATGTLLNGAGELANLYNAAPKAPSRAPSVAGSGGGGGSGGTGLQRTSKGVRPAPRGY